jgi:hypothetical protein
MGLKADLVIRAAIFAAVAVTLIILAASVHPVGGEQTFPEMHIDVEGGQEIVSKEEYLSCKITIDDEEYPVEDVDAGIRGRGNSTWAEPKKPYNLKFDKKIDLFGMGSAKKWVLLANSMDPTLCRNYFALGLAEVLGCPYTSQSRFVNLYVNGEYRGLYQLCEKVEIGKERVNIDDDTSKEEFGFLVQLDERAPQQGTEGVDYFMVGGKCYEIEDPEVEPNQVQFIKDRMQEAWDALHSGDWGTVQAYLDTDTFVSTYLVEEFFNDVDVDFSSFYLFRDAGGRLSSGPIWDFDLSAGNTDRYDRVYYSGLFVAKNSVWYSELLKYPEFREAVSEKLFEMTSWVQAFLIVNVNYILGHKGDFDSNMVLWNSVGRAIPSAPLKNMVITSWENHFDNLRMFIYMKMGYMCEQYPDAFPYRC